MASAAPQPLKYIAIMWLLLVAACSSSPTPIGLALQKPLASNNARVVLYYPEPIMGTDGMIQVRWNDSESCNLQAGTFFVQDVVPASEKLAFSFCGIHGASHFTLKAEAGRTYYLRALPYDSSLRGIVSGYPSEFDGEGKPLGLGPIKIERIEAPAALQAMDSMTPATILP